MSKEVIVHTVNAFTDADRGGNPAGVVMHPGLTPAEQQKVAARTGMSETVFISESDKADFKLDFFTPVRQVPDCGHATIGAFFWLLDQGELSADTATKEILSGVREVQIMDDMIYMELPSPTFSRVSDDVLSGVAHSLGFRSGDFYEGLPAVIGDAGLAFCLVPVASSTTLERIRPKRDDICYICNRLHIAGYLVFSLEPIKPGRHATSRMFAPAFGIHEEAATGTANAPLGGYLYTYAGYTDEHYEMEQGFFMDPPSPSLLQVRLQLDNSQIDRVFVGGQGVFGDDLVVTI